jgi:hypothetical protein
MTPFVRFYVRFAADHGFIHHFVTPADENFSWPTGDAGSPVDRFSSGIEPSASRSSLPTARPFTHNPAFHLLAPDANLAK